MAVVCLALAAGACGDDDSGLLGDQPVVIATTSIWADVVANVACDGAAEVGTVVPIGGDPHGFEPSLADRGEMERAALVVANGLGLEEGLETTIAGAEGDGATVIWMADHIDAIDGVRNADHDDEGEGADPHVWFDPTRVSAALPVLAERLVEAGVDSAEVDACLVAYQAELAALDEEIAAMIDALPVDDRRLITNHASLGYFADRYGLEVIGTVIPVPSGLAETSPAQLEALAELIETTGIRAVFAESQHSTDDVDALADRVGDVEVVTLSVGTLGEDGSGADTYVGLLRTNAGLIAEALG